jgi:hypothetical protein
VRERHFVLRYRSPQHWIETWRAIYGPLQKAFDTLDAEKQRALQADLIALIGAFNIARDGTMVVPSAYLEVIVTQR